LKRLCAVLCYILCCVSWTAIDSREIGLYRKTTSPSSETVHVSRPTHSHTHTHTLSLTHTHSHTHTHSLTHTHTHTQTHTHTHTLSHTHLHTHTHTPKKNTQNEATDHVIVSAPHCLTFLTNLFMFYVTTLSETLTKYSRMFG
jgi:hypothetical protein